MASKLASYLKKHFSKPDKSEDAPKDNKSVFILMHDTLHIGTLEMNNGVWSFEYSLIYKLRHRKADNANSIDELIQPLFAFPDIDKKYESTSLWPFFTARIPGLKQPDVQDIMKSDNIDSTDLVALLHRFGRKTIINPFELRLETAI